jgi:hypothetical protein
LESVILSLIALQRNQVPLHESGTDVLASFTGSECAPTTMQINSENISSVGETPMADRSSVVTTVEGPKGSADVVEIFKDGSNQPSYQVHFNGEIDNYVTEGEASIEAVAAVGK